MACKVKVNRHGFLAFRLYWNGTESWEGTGLKDNAKNRKRVEARAVLINEEMENQTFDYLKLFPDGNRAHLFKPKKPQVESVGQYFLGWIARKKPPFVRPALERDYRQQYNTYIKRQVVYTKLSDVDLLALENFRIYLGEERRLSLKSCRNIMDGTFRAMMRDARIDGLIEKDAFANLKWPRISQPKPDPFMDEERDKTLAYFHEKNRFYHPFVFTQFWTGMRPSEALALRWGDVDLKAGRASITKSRYYGSENATKTSGSERDVVLLPMVVELLRATKPLHATESDYVFKNHEGSPINEDKWRKKHWYRALRALGIKPRKFYATKHTYISVALSAGCNIKWLAEQCGTSVAMIEKHYGRYIKDDGDAPLRAILGVKNETFTETFSGEDQEKRVSVGNARDESWSGLLDLNQRLHGPEPCALPS